MSFFHPNEGNTMSKNVSMRISDTTDKYAEELQKDMEVSSKAAAVAQSIRITKQLSEIIKNGGTLYYTDSEGNKTNLMISSLRQ